MTSLSGQCKHKGETVRDKVTLKVFQANRIAGERSSETMSTNKQDEEYTKEEGERVT
ncbi:hypothetical protein NTE_03412 [Candidatus Nitrososphaera evergladensis SR1]|uniref:Uncharacterized protein n=1 Tax=Candidatus Nitrososphaera evergladensis SR1 TaxID=1459636 RepID=A0A075MW10_9ARCH|nr:hypothetical protein NTE_03412 [Candidatus Nitrososphaera evergladensis SR1]